MGDQGLFSGGEVNVLRWLTGAGIAATVAAMALLVAVLLKPRGKAPQAARWMLLLGIVVLPAASTVLGTSVGFSNVKNSCSECHTMDRWNADLRDPKSESLAAKHWQNRWVADHACYTCHTGYGFAGNLDAKLSGLGHVWREYVAGPPPLDRLRIHKPFDMKTCDHCHLEAKTYLAVEVHRDPELIAKMKSGEMSCLTCHAPSHPGRKE